jgi:hypothetical protein
MKQNELIEKEYKEISATVNSILHEQTWRLDKMMDRCVKLIVSNRQTATVEEILELLVSLPAELYYLNTETEFTALKEDVIKIIRNEKYNKSRATAKGTVQDKNNEAELAVLEEDLQKAIYGRVVKMLKGKIDMAYEMINSLKRLCDSKSKEVNVQR